LSRHESVRVSLAAILGVLCGSAVGLATVEPRAEAHSVEPEHSTLTVFVYKSGVLSAFAEDHVIRAPIARGAVSEEPPLALQMVVRAIDLEVLDPSLGPRQRHDMQALMLGPAILDAARYPDITFTSTAIEAVGPERWRVTGGLTIHGETRIVTFFAIRESNRYRGSILVKQRDFGIQPIRFMGGTVTVKDELKIEFDVAARTRESATLVFTEDHHRDTEAVPPW
jgi:hypothetical protein